MLENFDALETPERFDLNQYDFNYPEELVATSPQKPPRLLSVLETHNSWQVEETSFQNISQYFSKGDLLIINETCVQKRRVRSVEGFEVLFLEPLNNFEWHVLFPAKKVKLESEFELPGGIKLKLIEKGLPQKLKVIKGEVNSEFFKTYGEMALPPYIQKARRDKTKETKEKKVDFNDDEKWYQSFWAKNEGSAAAPTASLHFSPEDFHQLSQKGVQILKLTLHVGMGTFLPIKSKNIKDHKMHSEFVTIPKETIEKVAHALKNKNRVWALGSTSLRALEAYAKGDLKALPDGGVSGVTSIYIYPGYSFQIVSGLLTNFHQPQSTLLAMVAAFSSLKQVKKTYEYAIKNKFRLFSYGDLSLWKKQT